MQTWKSIAFHKWSSTASTESLYNKWNSATVHITIKISDAILQSEDQFLAKKYTQHIHAIFHLWNIKSGIWQKYRNAHICIKRISKTDARPSTLNNYLPKGLWYSILQAVNTSLYHVPCVRQIVLLLTTLRLWLVDHSNHCGDIGNMTLRIPIKAADVDVHCVGRPRSADNRSWLSLLPMAPIYVCINKGC